MPGKLLGPGPGRRGQKVRGLDSTVLLTYLLALSAVCSSWSSMVQGLSVYDPHMLHKEGEDPHMLHKEGGGGEEGRYKRENLPIPTSAEKATTTTATTTATTIQASLFNNNITSSSYPYYHRENRHQIEKKHLFSLIKASSAVGDHSSPQYPGGKPPTTYSQEVPRKTLLQLLPGVLKKMRATKESTDDTNPTHLLSGYNENGKILHLQTSQLSHKEWDTERSNNRSKTAHNVSSQVERLHVYIKSLLQILVSKNNAERSSSQQGRKSSQIGLFNSDNYDNSTAPTHPNKDEFDIESLDTSKSQNSYQISSRIKYDVVRRLRRSAVLPKSHQHRHSRSKSRSKRIPKIRSQRRWRKLKERLMVRLVRGPWLLAVSPNGSVYATKELHDPHTIFISQAVDAQLVALKTNISRKFLSFDKKGRLSTTRGLNRRTHFIVTPTLDNQYTYLSKYRSKHYWYLGITDTGNLTSYHRSRSRKHKKKRGSNKKKKPEKATSKSHTKTSSLSRKERDVRDLETVVIDSRLEMAARGRHEGVEVSDFHSSGLPPASELLAGKAPLPEEEEKSSAVDKSHHQSLRRVERTSPVEGKKDRPHRHSKSKKKENRRKNADRRRRKGQQRCKSQNCTCIRDNAIAPWCQFQIVPLEDSDKSEWSWLYHESALELSRSRSRSDSS